MRRDFKYGLEVSVDWEQESLAQERGNLGAAAEGQDRWVTWGEVCFMSDCTNPAPTGTTEC